ncbi:helix-turn-helix domain-containing protein [Arcobacter peruensis]|uniref:helix-turn-helix domain-containing protein n=1 Tax=Arcobacter peruensis TaxID=2320140 RepID=UPI000F08B4B4|nr:helix-turn-helix domain-containing protein [Arcobacter peruensis]
MYYFDEIINRLKKELKFNSDKELYQFMDVKQGTFTNWRARNKIPYENITTICVNNGFNLNYILGSQNDDNKVDIDYKSEIINTL